MDSKSNGMNELFCLLNLSQWYRLVAGISEFHKGRAVSFGHEAYWCWVYLESFIILKSSKCKQRVDTVRSATVENSNLLFRLKLFKSSKNEQRAEIHDEVHVDTFRSKSGGCGFRNQWRFNMKQVENNCFIFSRERECLSYLGEQKSLRYSNRSIHSIFQFCIETGALHYGNCHQRIVSFAIISDGEAGLVKHRAACTVIPIARLDRSQADRINWKTAL